MDVALESIPIQLLILHVVTDVDGAEGPHVVWEQRLLAARIRRLVLSDVRQRVVAVRLVDEEAAGLARSPGAVDHLVPHHAGVELSGDLAAARIPELVCRAGPHRS